MSYCRWSSDDFQCDVYCYESVGGGWDIHVAENRPVLNEGDLPPYVPFEKATAKEWVGRLQKVMEWVTTAERKPLNLPYDGQSFNEPTAKEAAMRMLMLRGAGYNVPQDAIDALLEEAAEEAR